MAATFSFVVITWNSEKTIEESLLGIRDTCAAESISYQVFAVDNGSKDGTVGIIERCAAAMPLTLIRLDRNRGTTVTRNMALRHCTGDIVCILDSDAVLLEGCLTDLADALYNDPSIGILAPKLIFPDGKVQESVRRFPSVLGKFGKIPGIILKIGCPDLDGYREFPFEEATEVDYAISACWFLRRNVLDEVGLLDEKIFYAPEDVDYGIRVWKNGMRTLYYPEFTVLHHVQQITHKRFFSKIALSHLLGLVYYFGKHRYIVSPRQRGERE